MKHSLVRKTIIETAARLFYQNGYNLTGINEIIREAGIAKATLYSHFRSKDDICLAYLQYKNEVFLNDIGEFVEKAPRGKGKLLALFDFLSAFFNDRDFNGCWCLNTVSEIPKEKSQIRKEIQKQKKELIQFIEQIIEKNIKNPKAHLSRQVYLLYESAVSESHLHQDEWPILSARETCEQLLK